MTDEAHNRFIKWPFARLLVLGMIMLACSARADPFPEFEARYALRYDGYQVGEATYRLSRQANDYRYESASKPTGITAWFRKDRVREHSQWQWQDPLIRPLRYVYERSGGRKERRAELEFDWPRGQVENRVEGQPWQMDIPRGTLDKLVVTLAMMKDLERGKKSMEYSVADGGILKTYRFQVVGEEVVDTPAGRFNSIKLERLREDNKRYTALWCAPSLHYLPVRIEQQEKDESPMTSELLSISGQLQIQTSSDNGLAP